MLYVIVIIKSGKQVISHASWFSLGQAWNVGPEGLTERENRYPATLEHKAQVVSYIPLCLRYPSHLST